jgi:hypothetical protein
MSILAPSNPVSTTQVQVVVEVEGALRVGASLNTVAVTFAGIMAIAITHALPAAAGVIIANSLSLMVRETT